MKRPAMLLLFFAAAFFGRSSRAQAELLLVVEVSDADADASARLLELIERPTRRLRLPEAEEPLSALDTARAAGAERAVILDGAHHRVHVLSCRDGTVLTRVVTPSAAQSPAYLAAFVAVELLALSVQLERATPASAPPAEAPSRTENWHARAVQRLAGEWIVAGEPFGGGARPAFGAGVWLASAERPTLWWVAELELGLLAGADVRAAPGHLSLSRSDAGLRAGLAYAFERVIAFGFAEGRTSFTRAEYVGSGGVSTRRLGFGVGLGAELDFVLAPWCALFTAASLDLATLRSDYLVEGKGVARDPAQLLSLGFGLAFFQQFR